MPVWAGEGLTLGDGESGSVLDGDREVAVLMLGLGSGGDGRGAGARDGAREASGHCEVRERSTPGSQVGSLGSLAGTPQVDDGWLHGIQQPVRYP